MSGDTINEQNILLDDGFDTHITLDSEEVDTAFNTHGNLQSEEVSKEVVWQDSTDFKPIELPMDLKARETQLILETLRQNSGHRQKTAEALNISPRTLRYKIAKLKEQGVDVP